ncbi:MAG: hypothetical protein WCS87_08465 [Methylococcaceae bacterium]
MNTCSSPHSYRLVSRSMFCWLILMSVLFFGSLQRLHAQDSQVRDDIANRLNIAIESKNESKIGDLAREAADANINPAEFQDMIKKNNATLNDYKNNEASAKTAYNVNSQFLFDFDKILQDKKVAMKQEAFNKLARTYFEQQIPTPPDRTKPLRENVTNALPGQIGKVSQAIIDFGKVVKKGMKDIEDFKNEKNEAIRINNELEVTIPDLLEKDRLTLEKELDGYLKTFNDQYNDRIKQNDLKKARDEKDKLEKDKQDKKDKLEKDKQDKLEKEKDKQDAEKPKSPENTPTSDSGEKTVFKGYVGDTSGKEKISLTEITDKNGNVKTVYTTTDSNGKVTDVKTYNKNGQLVPETNPIPPPDATKDDSKDNSGSGSDLTSPPASTPPYSYGGGCTKSISSSQTSNILNQTAKTIATPLTKPPIIPQQPPIPQTPKCAGHIN